MNEILIGYIFFLNGMTPFRFVACLTGGDTH